MINCDYYYYQKDRTWGEVVIEYCSHPDNPQGQEGNCNLLNCPVRKEQMKYGECGGAYPEYR